MMDGGQGGIRMAPVRRRLGPNRRTLEIRPVPFYCKRCLTQTLSESSVSCRHQGQVINLVAYREWRWGLGQALRKGAVDQLVCTHLRVPNSERRDLKRCHCSVDFGDQKACSDIEALHPLPCLPSQTEIIHVPLVPVR